MKHKLSIIAGATLANCALFGPFGLLTLLALLFNFNAVPLALGVYPSLNTQTVANYVTQNSKVQEELWIQDVLDTNGASVQSTPFADGMTGRIKAGQAADDSQLRKVVVEITDTAKVRGDTIHITSYAGIGGEGASGSSAREGTGANLITGNMDVVIGNQLFGVEYKQSEVDKTMIGKNLLRNPWIQQGIKDRHQTKKNDTILNRMKVAAGYGAAGFAGTQGANVIYPVGVANRAALKTAHTVDLPSIMALSDVLPGNGAMALDFTKDSGGSVGELFMFFAADKSLFDFESDPTNNQYLQFAAPRDKEGNPLFKGGFYPVRGNAVYRWIHRDHANYYKIGSPLLARAKLSVATTNTDALDLRGGGVLTSAATDTVPQWFQDFSNGPITMYGGVSNIAATTSTTRYVQIIGSGGYSIWSYTVNTGNKITTTAKVESTATTPYVHAVGDLIMECNVLGTIFGQSLMLGAQNIIGGVGSIAGNPAGPSTGRLIKVSRDADNDQGIYVEGCAGYNVVKRAGDNAYPGFCVLEHALSPSAVPGAKNVV